VLDYFTSALLAYGVAAALFKRERSGVGQYLFSRYSAAH
jgi:crotonobetainyl-CoA:carnitine CoA-transferase CaiB-like acyl-CoA transferase